MRTANSEAWPELPLAEWQDTYATLHMYMQVIGKIRLALTAKLNQWWNVPFYLTARGMTTSPIPYGLRSFAIDFDFIDHNLLIETSAGERRGLALVPRTVADFHREVFAILRTLDIEAPISATPVEVPDPIPIATDTLHRAYDAEYVDRFWQITRQLDQVFKRFRARFRGKCSPVHFFWGSFDLAVTRFSGRLAAPLGQDRISRDAYDEEVISLGFWPGDDATGGAALYSYTFPVPLGLSEASVRPASAFYSKDKREFLLLYDDVRQAADPVTAILEFAESTYEVGATLAGWNKDALAYAKSSEGPPTTLPKF
jgi:hypothetical protein